MNQNNSKLLFPVWADNSLCNSRKMLGYFWTWLFYTANWANSDFFQELENSTTKRTFNRGPLYLFWTRIICRFYFQCGPTVVCAILESCSVTCTLSPKSSGLNKWAYYIHTTMALISKFCTKSMLHFLRFLCRWELYSNLYQRHSIRTCFRILKYLRPKFYNRNCLYKRIWP